MRQLLRDWARPQGILLEAEWHREGDFLDLYGDVLGRYAANPEKPSPIEKTMCRSIASDVWRYDRETNDAAALMQEVVSKKSYSEARRNAFRDADDRTRLRCLHISSIRKSEELMGILKQTSKEYVAFSEENVFDMRKAK